MLRIIQNSAPAGAKAYYSTSDYYLEGQESAGRWRGQAADRLGLQGAIQKQDWDALCDNLDPATGGTLTARRKQDRRVGYDFNFHVPKSLSILYGLTGDERIVGAFRASVDATMQDIEREMQTRVRTAGRHEDRTTGNMVWGEFIHTTARPVDGVPDPHLHAHCFVFNTTWDKAESRWKAGQFAGVKRDGLYFEAVFHARLARRMEELGLETQRTKAGWELAGVTKPTLDKFSRRTALIEQTAHEHGVTDAKALDGLGAKTREAKQSGMSLGELRQAWSDRMMPEEQASVAALRSQLGREARPIDPSAARQAVEHAIGHCFERSAVVPERTVLATAIRHASGHATPEQITDAMAREGLVVGERDGRRLATTREVLKEEMRMVAFARNGRGSSAPLGTAGYELRRDWLNDGQRRAVRHLLESRDRVMVVRGGAGTGKTAMMKEAVEAIEAGGKQVFVFAPSADASRGVLREAEGFDRADTVARLLLDSKLQEEARNQVLWIDEAGLLGSRAMAQVFDLADRLGVRVILAGDRHQHGSVERGAALRLLEDEAGIVPAEVREIQRQSGDYKEAVRALGEGRVAAGFERLDRLGWVREVAEEERYQRLAEDYVSTIAEGKTALVVSPTHQEGDRVTEAVRARLKAAGRLGSNEQTFDALDNANLTEAQRADAVSYSPGDVLVFHQNAKGHQKGERVIVGESPLPLDQAARFQVYRRTQLPIAAGDALRVTRNGTTADGKHRLNNGAIYTVKGFTRSGDIRLANGWTVARDFGHLAHGYVVTSHASQGKTVDRVFIGQSSESFPASSREQFYVSASRGRQQVTVYTDDKEALLEAVSRGDGRLTATELVTDGYARQPKRLRTGPGLLPSGTQKRELAHER